MSEDRERWVATPRLRWASIGDTTVLQQWFAADVPAYMRRDAEGEWRDVPVVVGSP